MGQPAWGFPEELQKVVLKGEEPITCRPGELLPRWTSTRPGKRSPNSAPQTDMKQVICLLLLPQGGQGVLGSTPRSTAT